MAVNSRFNVKVPLNVSGSEIPGADHLVYWDNASGSFELTRSFEGGGGGGNQNLQSVTNFGKSSSLGGLFLWGQNLDWGNQTGINASSGFRTSSDAAYSHVTPQLRKTEQLLLTIPARRATSTNEYIPFPYPDNYITYGGARLGVSDGEGGDTDGKVVCSPKFDNDTNGTSFTFADVDAGDEVSVPYSVIEVDIIPDVGDVFSLTGFDNPEYEITMTCSSVDVSGDVVFTVNTVTVPSGILGLQRSFCLAYNSRKSNNFVVEGQGFAAGGSTKAGTAIIELRGNSGSGAEGGHDGGMLLSSAGNIYFFNATTGSVSGSLLPASASAKISLKGDNSLHFQTKNPLSNPNSESFKDVLVVSSSGNEPRVSIGFSPSEIPEKPFEIKTDKDDATGTELVLEGSRKTTPYASGDELGKISFLAVSSSFSGSERFTKGEGAAIRSVVSSQAKEGIKGELTFAIADNAELEPTASFKMQINGGYNVLNANPGINLVQSGSLVLTDRISGSTRERAGLFIGDASGSQTFRVTNLGSNTSYDDAELVLTGSAVISGSTIITGSVQVDGDVTANDYNVADGNGIGLANNYAGVSFNDGANTTIGFGGSWTMDFNKDNGVTLYELGHLGVYRDFRIEGNSDTHLFFVTGGDSRIGIGTSTPQEKLHVEGNISSSGDFTTTATGSFGRIEIDDTIQATNFTGSFMRLDQGGDGFRMTNRGAFDADGTDFRIFATNTNLKLASDGSSGTRLTLNSTKADFTVPLDVTGDITASGTIADSTYPTDNLLNLHDDNVVNANGVTLSSIGSTVFMIDSNNSGTSDKFEFRTDSRDAGAGTLLATIEDNGDLDVEGAITSQDYFVVSRSGAFTSNEFIIAVGDGAVTSSDALAVDSAGNLGIGTPNPEVRLHMLGEAAQTTQILMEQFNDTADAPDIRTRRYRGTSASRADVQAGDYLFRLNVHGQDGGSSELYGSMQYDVSSTDQDACVWRIQTRDEGGTNATRLTIDKAGDATFAGDLAINGISNVSASIAAAAGSGGGITQIDVGTGLDVTNNTGPTTTIDLDLTEVINTDGDNRVLTSDGDGTLTAERAVTINGGFLQFNDGDGSAGAFGIYTDLVNDVEGLTTIFVGDIAEIGPTPGSARTRGKLYNLNGTWGEARASASGNCTGLLAIATNNSADTEWLLRGYVTLQASTLFNGTFNNVGQVFYVDPDNSGEFTFDATSTTGEFIRACGHVVESVTSGRTVYYKIYFNPSPDFIEN
jgi:hypothetical protein